VRRLDISLLVCFALLSLVLTMRPMAAAERAGGMLSWPKEDMAKALSLYLPRRMAEEEIPGLAIAVVADGQIVFEQGYGVADFGGDETVTPYTIFEAASLGKPVVATAALGLVAEGMLSLDTSLGRSLEEPWLGDSDDHEMITLRHVLTHTSGLSNIVWCCSNESWSEPGATFSYSGVGYMYLGAVMAELTDMSFDKFMRARVLRPLGMVSSGYGLADALVPTVARGFVPYYQPLLVFFLPLLVLFAVFSIASILIVRVGLNRLKIEATDFVSAAVGSTVLTLGLIALFLGFWGFLFIVAYVLAFSVILFLGTLTVLLIFAFLGLLGPADGTLARGQRRTDPVMGVVAFGLVLGVSSLFLDQNVPVPAMSGETVNPAFSLRSSAHDLGLFVAGTIEGRIAGPQLRDRALSDSVDIVDGIGWGLGFGVRDGATGRTAWQWGSNPGFESIMVVDPARRVGLVVLTNSSKAGPLVQEIAGQVIGETPGWLVP
jgi:CubicO group peptidase (beta-lactamase class C family)